ncbi:leucine--tRNA ligase [Fervidicoccus fontis]|uniref:Leucine--tRNA ligase n=1 Tax=Fervidicoccus fontis TaxID=683846 RepID=A0A843AGG8_9CREN|nr:leucine--tRNA ligase [Fervidicoccus fontis]MBE9390600.1 leucine--tRNA ligase [Fervidicoccus fontis]
MEKFANFTEFDKSISKKWNEVWEKIKINEADPEPSRKKFYLTAAYPYPNGPLHLGHARTYLIPDVIARYKRLQGYNVLFPMAFHFTGTPILSSSEAIARGEEHLIKEFRELYEVSEEDLEKLKTPLGMANYFKERAKKDMKDYMLSIDWRREFTTIDPEYSSFITWQFLKLKERGYIVQGTHPVGWCPYHQMPVGMHDTKGDVEPEIQEYTLILFEGEDGTIYPTATLRPETIFGVTNLWVNEDAEYVIANIDGKKYFLSKQAFYKITFQKKNVQLIKDAGKGVNVLGKKVRNPITGKVVSILPSSFVDPSTGTGVVMSVPSHAPYDYVALKEIISSNEVKKFGLDEEKLKPVPVIYLKGYSPNPAEDVVQKYKIKSVKEKENLDKATKELYLEEFSNGVIREDLIKTIAVDVADRKVIELIEGIRGKNVKDVKKNVISFLLSNKIGDMFYEIANKPVYCRCGTEIVVKLLENQWFIDYENQKWKDRVRKALENRIEIVPEEYKEWFFNTIEWLKKRACARSRGLGTSLPWDKNWIIESLSDSTIYMAFYTVIKKIRDYKITSEKLTEEFWDYVFLGYGDEKEISEKLKIDTEVLKSIRNEFLYWYPLDNRHSGKDLVPNHLSFMLFNHIAIFPENLWPKRIVVNGHIMVEGVKMSKSLGNFIPMFKAIRDVGPNTLRVSLLYSAEIGNDANYSKELVRVVQDKLARIYSLIAEISDKYLKTPQEGSAVELDIIDKWFISKFKRIVKRVTDDLEGYVLRDAVVQIFFETEQSIEEYISIKQNPNSKILNEIIHEWIIMMSPFVPSFAEDLWHLVTKDPIEKSVFNNKWPDYNEISSYSFEELAIIYMERIISDIEGIKKALKKTPNEIHIIISNEKLWKLFKNALLILKEGHSVKELTSAISKEIGGYANPYQVAEQFNEFYQSIPEDISDFILKSEDINERELMLSIIPLLQNKLSLKVKFSEYEEGLVMRGKRPIPMKPVILFSF